MELWGLLVLSREGDGMTLGIVGAEQGMRWNDSEDCWC